VDAQKKEQDLQKLNAQLSDMPLKDPEALDPKEEELEAEDAREALQEAISGLALPDPERYMRANMRADGRKTPEPAFVTRGHVLSN
jgi:tryptophanyl-tRNA synthetase